MFTCAIQITNCYDLIRYKTGGIIYFEIKLKIEYFLPVSQHIVQKFLNNIIFNVLIHTDQPLNLVQPSQSLAQQTSPSQFSSKPNSSQNSAASSLSSLMLTATTNASSSNIPAIHGVHFQPIQVA